MTLVLPSALLLLMVAIEAFILRLIQGKEVPWNQIVFNLNSGHTILWVFRGPCSLTSERLAFFQKRAASSRFLEVRLGVLAIIAASRP